MRSKCGRANDKPIQKHTLCTHRVCGMLEQLDTTLKQNQRYSARRPTARVTRWWAGLDKVWAREKLEATQSA